MKEEEMVGWHHKFNGHRFGWTPGVGAGQGDLACYGVLVRVLQRKRTNRIYVDIQRGYEELAHTVMEDEAFP